MATPNTSFGDLLATTINSYSAEAADNLTKNSPFLDHLRKKGRVKSGGVQLTETIMYASAGNVKRYSGFDVIDVGVNNSHSVATYDWKQYASPVAISGLEMTQNSAKEQIKSLLTGRVDASMAGLKNLISDDMFSNGTADGGKQIGGTQLLVASAPTSGTVGGIDRSSNTFWQNVVFDATTNGGAATTAANITTYLARLYQRLTRNGESPDIILLDDYYYSLYEQAVMDKQWFENGGEGSADFAFGAYKFKGARVYCAGGFQGPDSTPFDGTVAGGIPYQTGYMLNTSTIRLRTAEGRNFQTIGNGKRISTNQDAEVQLIGWTGNLTMNCAFLNGTLVE